MAWFLPLINIVKLKKTGTFCKVKTPVHLTSSPEKTSNVKEQEMPSL